MLQIKGTTSTGEHFKWKNTVDYSSSPGVLFSVWQDLVDLIPET